MKLVYASNIINLSNLSTLFRASLIKGKRVAHGLSLLS